MKYVIFDIEADGLLDSITKIHCLSYCYSDDLRTLKSTTDYNEMKAFFKREDIVKVGHNIITYDLPAVKKILGIELPNTLSVDTLPVSWYLEPNRKRHGLESYGEEFKVPKPVVKDWKNLSSAEYIFRCEEDTKINWYLWKKQLSYLQLLYPNPQELERFLYYIYFKMDCVREQEEMGLKLDVQRCEQMLTKLKKEQQQKLEQLKSVMPKVPKIGKMKAPKVFTKKDGSYSTKGEAWLNKMRELNLPIGTAEIPVEKGFNEPNPRSFTQLKRWLTDLGWVPQHFKYQKNEDGAMRKIPQIASAAGGGEVCDSIKKLFKKEPKLEVLNGLSVINHRISIFEGFLKEHKNGRLYPTTSGLTNTFRLQHAVVVNLPSVERKYGPEIRGCIIADDGHVLCGSDLSNIESRCRDHYIFPYDPEYVAEMSQPGFDSHLDIAVLAGFITVEQMEAHKAGVENHKSARQKGKVVNFSAVYGVGVDTLSRNSGLPKAECKKLLDVYWMRNWAVKKVASEQKVLEIGSAKWLYNPVSRYYYSLRAEKDRFSTLNQGTAVYVFDRWIQNMKSLGIKIPFQYHDEVLFNVPKGKEAEFEHKVKTAIRYTNEDLLLNIQVGCSVQFGQNYADCH